MSISLSLSLFNINTPFTLISSSFMSVLIDTVDRLFLSCMSSWPVSLPLSVPCLLPSDGPRTLCSRDMHTGARNYFTDILLFSCVLSHLRAIAYNEFHGATFTCTPEEVATGRWLVFQTTICMFLTCFFYIKVSFELESKSFVKMISWFMPTCIQ